MGLAFWSQRPMVAFWVGRAEPGAQRAERVCWARGGQTVEERFHAERLGELAGVPVEALAGSLEVEELCAEQA